MSNLATSSRAILRAIREVTFGVIPVSGNPRNVRLTDESLTFDVAKQSSQELRGDRQIASATTVDGSSSGDVNFHMSYNEYDEFLEALLMNPFTTYGTAGVGTTFSAAYTATTITASAAPTTTSAFTLLQRGQFFRVSHAGNANDGKVFRVSTSVDPTSTIITLDAGTPASVVASTAGAVVQTSRLTNGVTEYSYSFEKHQTDVTQFMAYPGIYFNKLALKFVTSSFLNGTFSLMGKLGTASAGVTYLPGTPTLSKTFEIMNAVKGVGQLWEGGVPLVSTYIKSLDLNIDNGIRNQNAIANLGPVAMGVGDFVPSGTFQAYFATAALYNKFLADTYTSLTVSCQDAAGNGYVFSMPRVMLLTGKIVNGQKNSDVMAEFTYQGYADDANAVAALRKSLFVDRIGVAVS